MTDETIINLQETLAHHDRQINDLSDIIIKQGEDIDRLKKHILKLEDKITQIEDDAPSGDGKTMSVSDIAARDKPPHY